MLSVSEYPNKMLRKNEMGEVMMVILLYPFLEVGR